MLRGDKEKTPVLFGVVLFLLLLLLFLLLLFGAVKKRGIKNPFTVDIYITKFLFEK